MKFSWKIACSVFLLVAGFAFLFLFSLKGSGAMVYYLTVGEFLDKQGRPDLGENFRINGRVVEGTIRKPPGGLGARFTMSDGTRTLQVAYGKETPDTFVDGSEVVVEGALGPDGVFAAHTLLAKCPSKYEAMNTEANFKKGASENPARPTPPRGAATR